MVLDPASLQHIAAPMINQSDLPFRTLIRRHGATLVYTQMLLPHRLLDDQDYLEFHSRGLGEGQDRPVVAQLCGNDPETLVKAARTIVHRCDGIDLNLGCPQGNAKLGHYGAYLLGQKDWQLLEQIVSSLSASLPVPISVKLRLTQPASSTPLLASRLAASGASLVTLHARSVSARRRRHGLADLQWVRAVRAALPVSTPVVSNGNVRVFADLARNLQETGADGAMVGETLLGNPYLFEDAVPDPVRVSLEYLETCREFADTATMETVRLHVKHFVEFQSARRPWYAKFRNRLGACETLEDVERLLRFKVQRWRGQAPLPFDAEVDDSVDDSDAVSEAEDPDALLDTSSLF